MHSALGDDFDQFNDIVREAADALAPIRDAHAMLATFEDLRARHGLIDDAKMDGVRSAQLAAVDDANRGVNSSNPRIDQARTLLAASRSSAGTFPKVSPRSKWASRTPTVVVNET